MIRLNKTNTPEVLKEHGKTWTKDLLDKIATNVKPTDSEKTRYRNKDIKKALIEETNGKCAYCESKFLHVHHGDVEHIYPKSLAPEKTFEWENLTLACEICNQNKSNKDPYLEHIIDPYKIDPAQHLMFLGSFVFSMGTNFGKCSEVILDLNRVALCEARKEQLEKVMGIFETIFRDDLPLIVRKSIYENLLANEGSTSAGYSAMTRSIITTLEQKLPQGVK
jgi:5-methylcytosine-specific restriction endonuclease McrA